MFTKQVDDKDISLSQNELNWNSLNKHSKACGWKLKRLYRRKVYRVVRFVPIPNQDGVVASRIWERDWNSRSTEDPDTSETTGSFVECKRREIVKASNLILHLDYVCEILPRRNGACCSINSILKWVPPLLNPVPVYPNKGDLNVKGSLQSTKLSQ